MNRRCQMKGQMAAMGVQTLLRKGTGRHLCIRLYAMRCGRGIEGSDHERAVALYRFFITAGRGTESGDKMHKHTLD